MELHRSLVSLRSAHTIKFGAGVTRRQFTNYQSNSSIGLFGFDANATNNGNFGAGTGSSIASLLLGQATTAGQEPGVDLAGIPRVGTQRLCARQLMVAGQNGVSNTAGVNTDYSNFAPRFGFAATLAPGLVPRGGYGVVAADLRQLRLHVFHVRGFLPAN